MISKADSIPIISFSITPKRMRKAMGTENSKIFKSNDYIYV